MARKNNAWEGSTRWGNPKKPLKELDLLSQYNRLAERADKRLQRLEKKFGTPGYEGLENWSYARAMRDIKSWSGPISREIRIMEEAREIRIMEETREIMEEVRRRGEEDD